MEEERKRKIKQKMQELKQMQQVSVQCCYFFVPLESMVQARSQLLKVLYASVRPLLVVNELNFSISHFTVQSGERGSRSGRGTDPIQRIE